MGIYKQWLDSCMQASIPAINIDTCARIMAVVYEWGNNEAMTHNQKFIADIAYIQKRFGIYDGGTADFNFHYLLKNYVYELQDYYKSHKGDGSEIRAIVPQWANELFLERYNIELK